MVAPLTLERWAENEHHGTFGKIFHDGEFICDTVERPWLGNKNNISCIPEGAYSLEQFRRTSGKDAYVLINKDLGVYRLAEDRPMNKGRYACLIHPANWMTDVNGCVAPGLGIAVAKDKGGVERMMLKGGTSGVNTAKLFKYIKDNDIKQIVIIWKNHE